MGISSSTRQGQRCGPHPPRNVAVKLAHGVGPPRDLEPDDRHAERLVLVLRLDAAQAHELLVADAELIAQRAQMLFDQAAVKPVVAGRHRRVRGEDRAAGQLRGGRRRTRMPSSCIRSRMTSSGPNALCPSFR